MILFSIGLPAPFAEWCDAALLEIAQRALGIVDFLGGNSLDDVATSLINTGASHLVVGSRMPHAQVRKLFADSGTRFALALEDPGTAIRHLGAAVGWSPLQSLRAVANSCAFVSRYADLPGALVLRADEVAYDPFTVARLLNAHFGFSLSDTELQQAVDSLHGAGRILVDRGRNSSQSGLSELDQMLISDALEGYFKYFATGKAGRLTWRRELFLMPGPPVEPVPASIDVTGRGRCLFFGPDINLFPGFWSARIIFGCSREAVGISLMVDVCAGVQLSQTKLELDRSGIFEVTLRFFIDEGNAHPVQVRVFTERAAFDGRLALGRVIMIPQSDDLEDKELSAELGLDFD